MNPLLTNPLNVIAAGLGLAALILAWFVFDLHRKWRRMFGKKPPNGGGVAGEALERVMKTEQRLERIEPRVAVLETIGKVAVQKVGFLRFNPFSDTGGNQSFALALLDRENNGIIISSLYTREGVRVYAKGITGGTSKHPLSDEEKKVLDQALNSKP